MTQLHVTDVRTIYSNYVIVLREGTFVVVGLYVNVYVNIIVPTIHISAGFAISVGTAQHINIIDAFSYPLTKCVAVATHLC